MIDQSLIASNIFSFRRAFTQKKKITDQLYTLENLLTAEAISKLYDYILNCQDKPWDLETNTDYKKMHVPRRKIAWHAETIVEELHEIMSGLTPLVQELVKKPCAFHGIVLWEDQAGYEINWHSDNPILMATCQIYLAGTADNPGTEFLLDNGLTHVCQFRTNTGYFIDQTLIRPQHRTTGTVPTNNIRYSLFGMWK